MWTTVHDSSDPPPAGWGTFNAQVGYSVDITADGTLAVIGDPSVGEVYVFSSTDGGSNWAQLGGTILSAHTNTRFGASIAVDRQATGSDPQGTTVVVGEPGFSAPGRPLSGRVVVLEYIGDTWRRVLNDVSGSAENENFGETVAMVAANEFAAAGNRNSGRVAVYSVSGDL